ncbi:MAG TPA: sigma-54 dependent transcriptional regulator, partial [Nitrospiria bacterium]|nr:sigma-54 dependent transcriptional regulator [Nitrospiria bacterium]
ELHAVEGGEEALEAVNRFTPHLVLLDLVMPRVDGMTVLRTLREQGQTLPIIMLTATRMLMTAVEAMKSGASDYLTKPFDVDELRLVVQKALANQELEEEVKHLRSEVAKRYSFKNIIGKSKVMQEIYLRIEQIADTKTTVLITGESGTGKELVAKAVHYNSSRKDKPFVAINCAAIPDTLMETELFGHERGAFTNAMARRIGQFELSNHGTIFLDEIADLSLATQAKILRVLQEREFIRLGGTQVQKVDVRLITATNKDLEEEMKKGNFREDLFYRINVARIHLPPLRSRKEDIPLLLKHFLAQKAEEEGKEPKVLTSSAMSLLTRYDWRGNVRELENAVEQMSSFSSGPQIRPEDLPAHIRDGEENSPNKELSKQKVLSGKMSLEEAIQAFEREVILDALRRSRYIQTKAANLLGITRRMLKYKIDTLGITDSVLEASKES